MLFISETQNLYMILEIGGFGILEAIMSLTELIQVTFN